MQRDMLATNITKTLRDALAASQMSLWELSRRTNLKVRVIESALQDAGQVSVRALDRLAVGLDLELTLRPSEYKRQVGDVLSVVDLAIQRVEPEALVHVPSAPWVLALDLEGTLMGNVASAVARPGLHRFLTCCRSLVARLVVVASVPEPQFREVARRLVAEASAPAWFADVEYALRHADSNEAPQLSHAEPPFTLLVGGPGSQADADHKSQWLAVPKYEPSPDSDDGELDRILEEIARRVIGPPA
jgi:hypothetical protein